MRVDSDSDIKDEELIVLNMIEGTHLQKKDLYFCCPHFATNRPECNHLVKSNNRFVKQCELRRSCLYLYASRLGVANLKDPATIPNFEQGFADLLAKVLEVEKKYSMSNHIVTTTPKAVVEANKSISSGVAPNNITKGKNPFEKGIKAIAFEYLLSNSEPISYKQIVEYTTVKSNTTEKSVQLHVRLLLGEAMQQKYDFKLEKTKLEKIFLYKLVK